jgi:hypothetical protein
MSYNVIDVVKDELKGTADKLTKQEQKLRLDVCNECEHKTKLTRQCGLCGCFLDLLTKYKSSECHDNRWPF